MSLINVEHEIHLDKFQLRWYQQPIWDAFENKGYRYAVICLARRAGKDLCLWNYAIRCCLKETMLVYYVLPTLGDARRAIFDAITTDGDRFIDYIPKELITGMNASQLVITLRNHSKIQFMGALEYNRIRGTNPKFIILSEFAYYRYPEALMDVISPILAGNGGKLAIVSTPNGQGAFFHILKMAENLKKWFVYNKNIEYTKHISQEELNAERKRMSKDKFAQEYMCDFARARGSIYGHYLERMRQDMQFTLVPYEPGLLTYCVLDLGYSDNTSIIWYQVVGDGTLIRVIDYYTANQLGLDEYIKIIRDKPYTMGGYFAPHDMAVHEFSDGVSRWHKCANMGIEFHVLKQAPLMDGIENVKTNLPKMWIDTRKCQRLIDALDNYYNEWNEERQDYNDKPVHNWASHGADAMRYLCQSLQFISTGLSSEDIQRVRYTHLNAGRVPHNPLGISKKLGYQGPQKNY